MKESRDSEAEEPNTGNTISGGNVYGHVGQFGSVYGDVNLAPPRSAEEAAFRARYMAKMQEEWDSKEEAKKREEEARNSDAAWLVRVFVWLFVIAFVALSLYGVILLIRGKSCVDDTLKNSGSSHVTVPASCY